MGDPLSVAGTAVGIISLGIKVTQSLVDYCNAYRQQSLRIATIVDKLDDLLSIFKHLHQALTDRQFGLDEQDAVKNIERSIDACKEVIEELDEKCQKFRRAKDTEIQAKSKAVLHQLVFPFSERTLRRLDEDISDLQARLSFALNVLQLKDSNRIQEDIKDVRNLLDLVRSSQISHTVRDWLKAPDATTNFNEACAKRHPGTGLWLIRSPAFTTWLIDDNSFLWLNGFAGSGKSVLCSTAIQHTFRHRRSDPKIGIAFYYFSFSDESKQDESGMLRALVLQLSSQLPDGHTELARWQVNDNHGLPQIPALLDYLRQMIPKFQNVYVIVDALDESPVDDKRNHVLDGLEYIRQWQLRGLHLLVKSRDIPDIRDSLQPLQIQDVRMNNDGIDKDIADFVSGYVRKDRSLQKWHIYHDQIEAALTRGAKGVFRWVECQLKSLQSTPRSKANLDRVLKTLPKSLDESYERMLLNVDSEMIEDARRLLMMLCFATRPLKVQEVIDGLAVELGNEPRFNSDRRLQDENDILQICPGFIEVGIQPHDVGSDQDSDFGEVEDHYVGKHTIRIAHYSVQEYLESDRIRTQRAHMFHLRAMSGHAEIAQICLVYLLHPGIAKVELTQTVLDALPLASFAAEFWRKHYKEATAGNIDLDNLVLRLFLDELNALQNWIRIHDLVAFCSPTRLDSDDRSIASPLYYASLYGLEVVVSTILCDQDESSIKQKRGDIKHVQMAIDSNAQGELYVSALQAASSGGHEVVVRLLLEHGADINAQGGFYGNALQAASSSGGEPTVKLLLEHGADINAQGGFYGNALQTASKRGQEVMVKLLLENGAEVTAPGGLHIKVDTLQAISAGGYEAILRLLLEDRTDL